MNPYTLNQYCPYLDGSHISQTISDTTPPHLTFFRRRHLNRTNGPLQYLIFAALNFGPVRHLSRPRPRPSSVSGDHELNNCRSLVTSCPKVRVGEAGEGIASMEHRQPEQNGGRGCGTAACRLDDRATWFVREAQNLLVRNAMTDMSVCVIEDRTMYTIRYHTSGRFHVGQLIFPTKYSFPK